MMITGSRVVSTTMLRTVNGSAVFVGGEDLTDEVKLVTQRAEYTGTYSFIFRGTCRGEEVAIKVLKLVSYKSDTMQRKFRREIAVWTHVNHPNISPFYGYTNGSELFGPIGSLISPWYPNGDASKFLYERGEEISVENRIELWRGVVSGVDYLHKQDPQIVHGDLKPSNVLIDDDGNPRICDFGLSYIYMDEGHTELTTTSPYTGTERYLAPELLEDDAHPSTASDVWALGCIGLQFLYSITPYQHRLSNRTGQIFQDIRQGVPPASQPTHASAEFDSCWEILVGCWYPVPEQRIDAETVLLLLGVFHEQSLVNRLVEDINATYLGAERGVPADANATPFSSSNIGPSSRQDLQERGTEYLKLGHTASSELVLSSASLVKTPKKTIFRLSPPARTRTLPLGRSATEGGNVPSLGRRTSERISRNMSMKLDTMPSLSVMGETEHGDPEADDDDMDDLEGEGDEMDGEGDDVEDVVVEEMTMPVGPSIDSMISVDSVTSVETICASGAERPLSTDSSPETPNPANDVDMTESTKRKGKGKATRPANDDDDENAEHSDSDDSLYFDARASVIISPKDSPKILERRISQQQQKQQQQLLHEPRSRQSLQFPTAAARDQYIRDGSFARDRSSLPARTPGSTRNSLHQQLFERQKRDSTGSMSTARESVYYTPVEGQSAFLAPGLGFTPAQELFRNTSASAFAKEVAAKRASVPATFALRAASPSSAGIALPLDLSSVPTTSSPSKTNLMPLSSFPHPHTPISFPSASGIHNHPSLIANAKRPSIYRQASRSIVELSLSSTMGEDSRTDDDYKGGLDPHATPSLSATTPAATTKSQASEDPLAWLVPPPSPTHARPANRQGTIRRVSSFPFLQSIDMSVSEMPPPAYHEVPRREAEGKEKLPRYSNDIILAGLLPRKMEFDRPDLQARDRSWKKFWCVLEGTMFRVYKVGTLEVKFGALAATPVAGALPPTSATTVLAGGKVRGLHSSSFSGSRPSTPQTRPTGGSTTSSHNSGNRSSDIPKPIGFGPGGRSLIDNGGQGIYTPSANHLLRKYTLQNAESGLATDYMKRRNVIRVRTEGEQFLLQLPGVGDVVEWIEGFQAAANISADLDVRPMPKGPLYPRRRRRGRNQRTTGDVNQASLSASAPTDLTNNNGSGTTPSASSTAVAATL